MVNINWKKQKKGTGLKLAQTCCWGGVIYCPTCNKGNHIVKVSVMSVCTWVCIAYADYTLNLSLRSYVNKQRCVFACSQFYSLSLSFASEQSSIYMCHSQVPYCIDTNDVRAESDRNIDRNCGYLLLHNKLSPIVFKTFISQISTDMILWTIYKYTAFFWK